MKQNEQRADELEQHIQAKQKQQAVSAGSTEAKLAEELIQLADNSNPSTNFVAELEHKLQQRANQLQTRKIAPDKPSFWRDLQQLMKEGFTMKPIQALGGMTIILLFGVFAFALFNFNQDNASQQLEEEFSRITSENPVIETLPENDAATSGAMNDPNAEIADALPPQEGAPLPRFENQPASGGLGGGGGAASSGPSMPILEGEFDMMISDPFSGTVFALDTTLPTDNVMGIVQQRVGEASIDAAKAQQIATAYGFTGALYMVAYIDELPLDGPITPHVSYIAFDGVRSLRIEPWAISYSDEAAATKFNHEDNATILPNAATIAETFLQERGQLDFSYELRVNEAANSIDFHRTIQDTAVNEAEISVTLNADGEVVWVWDSVPSDWEEPSRYPLVTAEMAWQKILDGVTANQIVYQIFGDDTFIDIPTEPFPIGEAYQSWMRTFTPGNEVHLYALPMVYQPVNGGTPLIKVRNYTILADDATLNSLSENRDTQIHLWGTFNEDNSITLTSWEAMNGYDSIYLQGTAQRDGEQLLFTDVNGNTYILPDAPADIENGLQVNVFGYGIRDIGLAHPVLDWENIDKYIEYPDEPIIGLPVEPYPIEGMPIEPFMFMSYENVQINAVQMAYVVTYLWPEMKEEDLEMMMERPSPTIVLQPAWQFTGTAENGETVKLWVQAVEESYLR